MMCIEIGSRDNPCRCKIVGPTLGFCCGVVAAALCWPVGVLTYLFSRGFANRAFAKPVDVWTRVKNAIPL